MLMTKRYDYVPFEQIQLHPGITNHRAVNQQKVAHYTQDILSNGLLEPLVVWERKDRDFFLVGGFHRLSAITAIRDSHPDYFDRVDVRVVSGELDEMRALNLKLNADRLEATVNEYFDVVIHLINANWEKQRIADFLDKSLTWIEDIVRFVPSMDQRVRALLDQGRISWNKAKQICRKALSAEPGKEKEVIDQELAGLSRDSGEARKPKKRPLTFRSLTKRLSERQENQPKVKYTVGADDLMDLVLVLEGKRFDDAHLERARNRFPGLLD